MRPGLRRALVGVVLAAAAAAPVARADSPSADRDRFFIDKIDDDATADATLWQGSLTSTSFFHRENAAIGPPLTGGTVGTENATPFMRLFTDLRAQLDARHIKGGPWDGRIDGRVRYVPKVKETWKSFSPQSGTFSAATSTTCASSTRSTAATAPTSRRPPESSSTWPRPRSTASASTTPRTRSGPTSGSPGSTRCAARAR